MGAAVRIFVERSWGFGGRDGARFAGAPQSHSYEDVTGKPMPTVTERPVHFVVVLEEGDE